MENINYEKVLDFLGKAKPAALVAAIALAGIFGVIYCTKIEKGNMLDQ